jgi:hypothetical protein
VVGVSDREASGSEPGPGTGSDADARTPGTDDAERSAGGSESGGSGDVSDTDEPERARNEGGRFGTDGPVGYLKWAGVAVLAVTALVALFGFYTGVSRAISVWVTREYRPLVNAAFNLALLLAALGGIGLLLRRID